MVKDIICVACPMGCQISVELNDGGEILSVTGNTCKRGDAYARTECTHPERSLTTTVKVSGGVHPVVPVKSAKAVPKDKVKDCVKEIAKLEIKAPVKSAMLSARTYSAPALISLRRTSAPRRKRHRK